MAALVYGGSGQLGRVIVSYFRSKNWKVTSVDFAANAEASSNILLPKDSSWESQSETVLNGIPSDTTFKGIFCVAGGWAGGGISDAEVISSADLMWKQSVHSSVIAGQVAARHLEDGGVLQLTGSSPCSGPTPGMLGYGMAKAAVHQLVLSLSDAKSGLPNQSKVFAIAPITLDTPMNRKFMPEADFTAWTPLEEVAAYGSGVRWSQASTNHISFLSTLQATLCMVNRRKSQRTASSEWRHLSFGDGKFSNSLGTSIVKAPIHSLKHC